MYNLSLRTRNKYFPSSGATEAFQNLAAQVDMTVEPEFEGYIESVHLGDQIIQATK